MSRRILTKVRNFRILSGLVIASLTILSFQNCAPPPAACGDKGGTCNEKSGSSTTASSGDIWGGRPGYSGTAGAGSGAGNSGGSSGSYFPGTGGGSGGAVDLGGGSSGGGGGVGVGGGTGSGSNDSGGGGTQDPTFRISKQPEGLSVIEGSDFQLMVNVSGGKAPYKYQWFLNGRKITGGLGEFPFYTDIANSYFKEGTYSVEVSDGNGTTIRSTDVRVGFMEPQVGCPVGKYFILTKPSFDFYNYISEYVNGPRGTYLLYTSYDINGFYGNATSSVTGATFFQISKQIAYKGAGTIPCTVNVPGLNEQPRRYETGAYSGGVNFECRNQKLKFVSNTCRWVPDNYEPPSRGGDR